MTNLHANNHSKRFDCHRPKTTVFSRSCLPPFRWVGILLMGIGCNTNSDTGFVDTDIQTDSGIATSLRTDVMPIIEQSCGGCHTREDAPFPDAVINGAYYDEPQDILNLVGSFITPGDANNSGFVAILTQDLAVGQGPTLMPPPKMASAMPEDDVAVIRSWINEGALDN